MFKVCISERLVGNNPAKDVPYRSSGSEGHKTWGMEQVRQFEERHPIGSKARLALALLLYLGQRRGDTAKFGRQHIRNADQVTEELRELHGGRWLAFTQQKNRKRKPVTLWLPIIPDLEEIMAASPLGELTFLVSAFGNGFTEAGFGNWFRDRCDEAGLEGYSAHGVRKAGATQAAERGASEFALMAIFGWRSGKQAVHYTRAANQKILAASSMHLLGQGKNRIATPPGSKSEGVAKTTLKPLKSKSRKTRMVPRGGIEPPTLRFSIACSTN
jgi:integrase